MAWITYDDVVGVVTKALDDGVAAHLISTRYVRDRLGSGGLSTISNHLKKYWTENAAFGVSAGIMASDSVQDLHRVLANIVVEQTAEVRAAANARAEQDAVRVAELTGELTYTLETNGQLETVVSARDAEIDRLRQILSETRDAVAHLEGEVSAAHGTADRERERLAAERDLARAETLKAQLGRAESIGKLELYEREFAEMSEQAADVVAGQQAAEAKIARLQGALDERRREVAVALAAATLAREPTLVTLIPPGETPHPLVQAGSTGEVDG